MSAAVDEMKIKAIAPWFGSNRMLASRFCRELDGCNWVGVPFAGGMSELAYIHARTIVVNDIHRHVINLARVVAEPELRTPMLRELSRKPFHPDELDAAQERCKACTPGDAPDIEAATDYFVCVWMGRSHIAGGNDEFHGRTSTRWNASGGDSVVRYRSAIKGMVAWSRIMRRCTFRTDEAIEEFLPRCEDTVGHGLYCDPPFPGPGARYKHTLTIEQHESLADVLSRFKSTRVVCRFYDHPLVRRLYPSGVWQWHSLTGRTQANTVGAEVLLINGPSLVQPQGLFATPTGANP